MICSLCVRRLSDCCELKFQIEQSEQFLLNVVANRLFMGLNNDYADSSNDQELSKSTAIIIDTIQSVVTDFESSYADGNEIIATTLLHDKVLDDVQDVVAEVVEAAKDNLPQQKLSNKSTHSCRICLKKFSTSCRLEQHLVSKHLVRNDLNIDKPHQCEDCPKSYTTKANLVLHRAVHSGTPKL